MDARLALTAAFLLVAGSLVHPSQAAVGVSVSIPLTPVLTLADYALKTAGSSTQTSKPCTCCLTIDLGTHATAKDTDEHWLLGEIPTLGNNLMEPVQEVSPKPAAWAAPTDGEWVSVAGNALGPLGDYEYFIEFTIEPFCYDGAVLDLWFSGHTDVQVSLDGDLLAGAPAMASGSIHPLGYTALLPAGTHRLSARVAAEVTPINGIGIDGFLAEGVVRAWRSVNLDLSTGVDAVPGNPPIDDDWTLLSGPPGCCTGLAYLVNNPPGAWTGGVPIVAAGARWINHNAQGGTAGPGGAAPNNVPYVYRTTFSLPDCDWIDGDPTLSLQFTADNNGAMYLDNVPLASVAGNGFQTSASYSGTVPAWPPVHVLEARVMNTDNGTPTGFIASVRVTATCAC